MSVSSFSIKQVRSAASVSDSVHVFIFMAGFDCKLPPDFIDVVMISFSVSVGGGFRFVNTCVFIYLCLLLYSSSTLPRVHYVNCVFVSMIVYIVSSEFTGCINLLEFSQQRALHHHT